MKDLHVRPETMERLREGVGAETTTSAVAEVLGYETKSKGSKS